MARNSNENQSSGGGPTCNGNAVVDPSQDSRSHYYVHSTNGPSSVVVTPPLSSINYHVRVRSMRRALGGSANTSSSTEVLKFLLIHIQALKLELGKGATI